MTSISGSNPLPFFSGYDLFDMKKLLLEKLTEVCRRPSLVDMTSLTHSILRRSLDQTSRCPSLVDMISLTVLLAICWWIWHIVATLLY